ncbi:movement protein [Bromus catharticus striate mosaic virus]|uniref:Movement protein n=1 Tax=Bromus catharticus striate mosaic virus TaxID=936005 RepID=E7D4Y0_9GEMI|nr:movement protein [Bromus catharticus striate mosaic virus]ADT91302.1 movement protein [Bromus catharticus striate mosaic virus]
MAEYPQSAFVLSGAIPHQSKDEGFASSLKVTALSLFAAFIAAAILCFLYKTCLADCYTQYRTTGLSSTSSSGFGRTSEASTAVPRTASEVSIPLGDRSATPSSCLPTSGISSI